MDDGIDAIVNYVLSPTKVNITDFVWKKCCDQVIEGRQVGFVVYRGQSIEPRFRTIKGRFNPNKARTIQTTLGRPLSTSTELNMHIISYALPDGRVFKIHVTPGVEYVDVVGELKKAEKEGKLNDDYFQKVLDSLPVDGAYRKGKVDEKTGEVLREPITTGKQMKEAFWKLVAKENEVILNPTGIYFRSETDPEETWNNPDSWQTVKIESPPGVINDIEVYETGAFPKKAGRRGRTFRRKARRLNKNGSRPTRKSKRHVRNGHA